MMRSENEVSPTPPSRSRGIRPHACPVGQTLTSNSWSHSVHGNFSTSMSFGTAQNSTSHSFSPARINHESSLTPASPTTPAHPFGTTAMRTGPVGRYTPDVAVRTDRMSTRTVDSNAYSRAQGGLHDQAYGHGVHRTLPRPNHFASPYPDSASGAAASRSNAAQSSSVDFDDLRHIPGVILSNNENVRPERAPGLSLQSAGLQETDDIEDQMDIDDVSDPDELSDDPSMDVSEEELILQAMPSTIAQNSPRAQALRQFHIHAQPQVVSAAALKSIENVDLETLEESDQTCIICYTDYNLPNPEDRVERPVRLPKCRHVFGHLCLSRWLADHTTCPHCRDRLPTETIRNRRAYQDAYARTLNRERNRRAELLRRSDTSIHNPLSLAARPIDQAILEASLRHIRSRHRGYERSSSTHAEISRSQSGAEFHQPALPRRDISRHMPQSTRNDSALPSDFARSDSSYGSRPLAPLTRTNTGNVEERSYRDQHLLQPNHFASARGSTHQSTQMSYPDLQYHSTQTRSTISEAQAQLQYAIYVEGEEVRSRLQNRSVLPQPRTSATIRTTLTSPLNYDHLTPWQLRELLATNSNPSDTAHAGLPSGSGNHGQYYGWTTPSSPGATLGSEAGLSDFSTTAVYGEGSFPPPFFSGSEDIESNYIRYGYDV